MRRQGSPSVQGLFDSVLAFRCRCDSRLTVGCGSGDTVGIAHSLLHKVAGAIQNLLHSISQSPLSGCRAASVKGHGSCLSLFVKHVN